METFNLAEYIQAFAEIAEVVCWPLVLILGYAMLKNTSGGTK